MTRLTLRIIQDQLARWVICLLGCAVLLTVNLFTEQKFNPKLILKASLSTSLHVSLAWGIYHARCGPKRISLATASLGLPSMSWWGPMLFVWLMGSALVYIGDHYDAPSAQASQVQLWPCTWRTSPSSKATQTGVCFATMNEQGVEQLRGWTTTSTVGPVPLSSEQVTQARPTGSLEVPWGEPFTRWVSRILFVIVMSLLLLCVALEHLGVYALFSYALSWLFERSLIH